MLKNIKLTPLSVVIATCITYAFFCLLGYQNNIAISNMAGFAYSLSLACILFITDLLFRKFIPNKKQLWIIETAFILLILTIIIIFNK